MTVSWGWHLRSGQSSSLRFRFSPLLRLGFGLDVASFLATKREGVREQEITQYTAQGAVSLPLLLSFTRWSLGGGPWAQLRLQRARGVALGSMSSRPTERCRASAASSKSVGRQDPSGLWGRAWLPAGNWRRSALASYFGLPTRRGMRY